MKCRKCAAQIPDNSVRCPNCGIKVSMHCPNCGTSNLFGNKFCTHCGFALLKKCPDCGAVNVYSADKCRKCGFSFSQESVSAPVIENSVQSETADIKTDNLEEVQKTSIAAEESNLDTSQEEVVSAFSADVHAEDVQTSPQEPIEQNYNPISSEIETKTFVPVDDEIQSEKNEDNIKDNPKIDNNNETQEQILINDIEPIEEDINIDNQNFDDDEDSQIINTDSADDFNSVEIQSEIVERVSNSLKNSITKHIIALQGEEGSGKSVILKQIADLFKNDGFLFLYGSCTPLLQITSFGFFQDAFLRIMGFPTYTKTTEAFFKDFKKSRFYGMFNFLSSDELELFLNIFYPVQKDKFDNILINRQVMFSILEKVIKSFSLNNNLIIAIDNFELLDGASYDFIVYMLKKGYFFNNRIKLLTAYQEDKKIQSYFDIAGIDENIFEMINIKKLSPEEMINAVKHSLSIDVTGLFLKNI